MIREARHEDLAELVDFVMECDAAMPWGQHGLRPETDSVIHTLLDLMETQDAGFWCVDISGRVCGACAVVLSRFPWSRGDIVASEWIWHMRPSFPEGHVKRKWVVRMLDQMLEWSRANGAGAFKASAMATDKALARLLERRGISPMETACVGRI